jgi:hypothetical protein
MMNIMPDRSGPASGLIMNQLHPGFFAASAKS